MQVPGLSLQWDSAVCLWAVDEQDPSSILEIIIFKFAGKLRQI